MGKLSAMQKHPGNLCSFLLQSDLTKTSQKLPQSSSQSSIWVFLQNSCNWCNDRYPLICPLSPKDVSKKLWDNRLSWVGQGSSKSSQKEVALLKEYTLFNPGMYLRKIPKEWLCEVVMWCGYVMSLPIPQAEQQPWSPNLCQSRSLDRDGTWERQAQSAVQRASFLSFQFNPALPGHCCELWQFDGRGTGSTNICAWSCSAKISLRHSLCSQRSATWGAKPSFARGDVQAAGPKWLEPCLCSQHVWLSPGQRVKPQRWR